MYSQSYSIQRPPIDKLLATALGLVALLVVLLAVLPANVVSSVLRQDAILTQRLDPMAASSARILNLMVDQETGERGYVITADESFLEPYTTGHSQLESLWPVAQVQADAVGGQAPSLLAAVHRSALAWQTQAADVEITDVRSGYQQDALSAVASGRSRTLFIQFRSDSDALSRYIQQRQVAQTAMRDQELARFRVIEGALVGVGLLALGLLGYAAIRYVSLLRHVVLAESEARFRSIVETANEGVWLVDGTGHTLLANQRMAEVLGASLEDVATGGLLAYCYPDDLPEARQRIQQNLIGQSGQFDFRFRRGDGSPLLVLACTSPMRNAAGDVIGVLGMFSDITARKQAEEERLQLLGRVQEAHETAVEALEMRDHFLSAVSHDLRSPLTTARGVTQMVMRQLAHQGTPESARLAESLAAVEKATGSMNYMIGELLDLAQLRAGRPLSLNRRRTDLVKLARQLAADQQQAPGRHRVLLETNVPALVGSWDPARMERVLTNLLSNAVKYSPDGGPITISVSGGPEDGAGRHCAMLQVRDQGLGIPEADLPHIFEPFHRGANVEEIAGVGIGLTGAKQIVEQHGGTLSVDSEQGKGTVFTLRLPIDDQGRAEG